MTWWKRSNLGSYLRAFLCPIYCKPVQVLWWRPYLCSTLLICWMIRIVGAKASCDGSSLMIFRGRIGFRRTTFLSVYSSLQVQYQAPLVKKDNTMANIVLINSTPWWHYWKIRSSVEIFTYLLISSVTAVKSSWPTWSHYWLHEIDVRDVW